MALNQQRLSAVHLEEHITVTRNTQIPLPMDFRNWNEQVGGRSSGSSDQRRGTEDEPHLAQLERADIGVQLARVQLLELSASGLNTYC